MIELDVNPAAAISSQLTWRWYTPFGQFRPPVTGSWPGTRRFVGGTYDSTTSLTNLGAREYNPATPGFISPDPVLNPQDPVDPNPYNYAANNPATNSDPSGLMPWCGGPCYTPPPPPAPSPAALAYDLQAGNYGAVSSALGIPRQLLFPEPPRPVLTRYPTICGREYLCGYHYEGYNNDSAGVTVAFDWLLGFGSRHQYFNQWDPLTRQLMRDEHMQYVTGLIRNQVEAGNYYGVGGRRYNYKDPANPVSPFGAGAAPKGAPRDMGHVRRCPVAAAAAVACVAELTVPTDITPTRSVMIGTWKSTVGAELTLRPDGTFTARSLPKTFGGFVSWWSCPALTDRADKSVRLPS